MTMPDAELEDLRRNYPSWNIRLTTPGGWPIATRIDREALTDKELEMGLANTLMSDRTGLPMSEQLANQARIESELP